MTGHQKRIATTCGAGEFVVGIQENGDPLCEAPFDTVIEDISGDGWSDTKTIEQQPFGMLLHGYIWLTKSLRAGQIHGPFGGDVQSISKEYTTLADHCELEITLRYWAIDRYAWRTLLSFQRSTAVAAGTRVRKLGLRLTTRLYSKTCATTRVSSTKSVNS